MEKKKGEKWQDSLQNSLSRESWNKLALLFSAALFMPRKSLDIAETAGNIMGGGELINALLINPP